MSNIKSLIHNNKLATAMMLAPILFLGLMILFNAVNIVYWDEWELTPVFQHIHAGHIYWADFWNQHNEHRIFFPTIALVLLAQVTHWNVVVECLVSFAVAGVSFWLLLHIFKNTAKTTKKPLFLMLLLSLVWFSPVQVENWLWGWQLEWFLSVLGIMLMTFGLSTIKNSKLSSKALIIILAGGVLAQYSLGNGTLVWPIIFVTFIYSKLPIKQIAVTAVTGIITTALYYLHYINPVGAPPRSLALHEPIAYTKFVLLYLGRPLAYFHGLAMLAGFLLLTVFVCLSAYLFVGEKKKFKLSIPWIFLGLYAIASALVTGLARLGFGVDEAGTSRYTTISSLLLISTIVLCWQNRSVFKKLMPGHVYRFISTSVVLIVFACVLSNIYWGAHAFNTQHKLFTYLKTCTHQSSPSDQCLLKAYPARDIIVTRLDYLKSIHWAGY